MNQTHFINSKCPSSVEAKNQHCTHVTSRTYERTSLTNHEMTGEILAKELVVNINIFRNRTKANLEIREER